MKTLRIFSTLTGIGLLAATGCRTDNSDGVQHQPGPNAGKAVGVGVGVVAGNVAGAGVGVVQGTAAGVHNAFSANPNYHMVRYWKTETTADGRTIQVPYDVMVDQYGRTVNRPAPTGNPAPPPVAPAAPAAPMTSTNAAGQ